MMSDMLSVFVTYLLDFSVFFQQLTVFERVDRQKFFPAIITI